MAVNTAIQHRRDTILERIETLDSLPSLPRIVSQILRLLSSGDYSSSEMMELIQKDPALTARVLKLANSATYGRSRQIDSLGQAIVMLGAQEIQRIVTTISVMRAFEGSFNHGSIDREAYWAHCLSTAELTQRLARIMGFDFEGADFTAALLHDVGKIVLDQHFHPEFVDCLRLVEYRGIPLFEAEKKLLALDHTEVGALLGERWHLPENLIEVIRWHHDFDEPESRSPLLSCVRLANHLVKSENCGCLGEESDWLIEQDPAWLVLVRERSVKQEQVLDELKGDIGKAVARVREMVNELL